MNFENQEKNYFFVIKFFLQMRILKSIITQQQKTKSKIQKFANPLCKLFAINQKKKNNSCCTKWQNSFLYITLIPEKIK